MIIGSGTVRAARLTDRQALSALSHRVHAADDAHRRSLGIPASSTQPQISLATLIPTWIPLRPPSVHLVAESDGQLIGSCRAIEEPHRDDWVITELDAADGPMAAEVRWALLRALIDEGANKNVARYHVACSDVRENLELLGQANFVAYAQEEILYLPPATERGAAGWLRRMVGRRKPPRGHAGETPDHWGEAHRAADQHAALQPAGAPDAWHLFDLWTHATPPAIARLESYAAADWEAVGHEAIVPARASTRSSTSARCGRGSCPTISGRAASRSTAPAARVPTTCASWSATAPMAWPSFGRRWMPWGRMPLLRGSSLRCEHMSRRGCARHRPPDSCPSVG